MGAGSSAEAGIPAWRELVHRLVMSVLRSVHGLSKDDSDELWDWIERDDGLPAAAALVQAVVPEDQFVEMVRSEMYGGHTPGPGPLASVVAALARDELARGGRPEIVTTNYDDLLHQALINSKVRASQVRTYRSRTTARGVIPVRHLHGILTPTRKDGRVVLSEREYYSMQVPSRWQEQYFRDQLRQRSCLFVGTSLTDPNLLRYLYRSTDTTTPDHYALFTRQFESSFFDPSTPDAVKDVREISAESRWKAIGIHPIRPDFAIEAVQFVYELAVRRACEHAGTTYRSYATRAREWRRAVASRMVSTTSDAAFRRRQDEIQELLSFWLSEIKAIFESWGYDHAGERLGLHLWVRTPSADGQLLNWGGSDRSWRDSKTLQPVPLIRPTQWIAVEAWCAGVPAAHSTEHHETSRWNYVLGLPVILHSAPESVADGSDPYGRLPVGVVTLASDQPEHNGVLGSLSPHQVSDLARVITDAAVDLLRDY